MPVVLSRRHLAPSRFQIEDIGNRKSDCLRVVFKNRHFQFSICNRPPRIGKANIDAQIICNCSDDDSDGDFEAEDSLDAGGIEDKPPGEDVCDNELTVVIAIVFSTTSVVDLCLDS